MQTQTQFDVTINGAALVADISGALYWPAGQALIVADLHFEKGSAFAARGVALPPYDTAATLDRLEAVLAHYRPKTFISLGDAFHDAQWQARMGAEDARRLAGLAAGQQTIWVTGNHDPSAPKGLSGSAHAVLSLHHDGCLCLRHEPLAVTDQAYSPGELAGHLHPCGKIRQRGRNLRRRCFVHDTQRMVLPAFGALTGSLNVRDAAFDGLFAPRRFEAILLGQNTLAQVGASQLVPDVKTNGRA